MDNDKLMKLILAPSSHLGAYYKMIEQQEKIAKSLSPVLTIGASLQNIVRNYENFNRINKSFKVPIGISNTIQLLGNQPSPLTHSFSKYHYQLNAIVNAINPAFSRFIIDNSISNFRNTKSLTDIDFSIVSSFESIKDDYDEVVQAELETIKNNFETQPEFKNSIENLLSYGEFDITTDIYQAIANLIEKFVGITNSKTIALFLNIIITTYCILMPFYQNYQSVKTEERFSIKINLSEEKINDSDKNSETKTLNKVDSLKSIIELNEQKMNKKLDLINKKLDKLDDNKIKLKS